ncbi:MAG TPA: orotidine-5'-phosphate decarboxylase [Candidatus Omnitrophota bacterium]|nr:orotidine-5'-phosphate decarboxylase [Candidatus Omnitrophota bacterium]HPN65861.1 orotidine-5'-phosphate decarboxylase [Candidatus Omnitrophota bacterium]HRZ66551.1 orotidine-5'-phosphate decarboxylase [Candidatus Omnitrophota bacterium]
MPENIAAGDKLIVALDMKTLDEAAMMVKKLSPAVRVFKVGMGLFTAYGPDAVKMVHDKGAKVFLDLKFHDIPNTVAHAVRSAAKLGVFMMNIHAMGGSEMMSAASSAAAEAAAANPGNRPILLGVTVLTSMDQASIGEIGVDRKIGEEVITLARLAKDAGLDGVVASPNETSLIRQNLGKDFVIVTPGIRPAGSEKGDQKRTMAPDSAIRAGADYIVVGRPVIEAKDPAGAAKNIIKEMEG